MVWHTEARHLCELTVPWEKSMGKACEGVKLRYGNPCMKCEDKEWACQVMPAEVVWRGFIGGSTTLHLTRATQQLQTAAERASSWICSKIRKSTTSWRIRPSSSLSSLAIRDSTGLTNNRGAGKINIIISSTRFMVLILFTFFQYCELQVNCWNRYFTKV